MLCFPGSWPVCRAPQLTELWRSPGSRWAAARAPPPGHPGKPTCLAVTAPLCPELAKPGLLEAGSVLNSTQVPVGDRAPCNSLSKAVDVLEVRVKPRKSDCETQGERGPSAERGVFISVLDENRIWLLGTRRQNPCPRLTPSKPVVSLRRKFDFPLNH